MWFYKKCFLNSPPQHQTDLSADNEESHVQEHEQLLWMSVDQRTLSFACADQLGRMEGEEREEPAEL